jgi:ATP/maltotriose-dependent transcriptional regulator MalT
MSDANKVESDSKAFAPFDSVSPRHVYYEAVCRQDLYLVVQLSVRLVDALLAVGEHNDAVAILLRALKLGASAGLYQTFIDSGVGVGELLEALHRGAAGTQAEVRSLMPYIGSLLARRRMVRLSEVRRVSAGEPGVVLSTRERTILTLMSQGMSNKQIAIHLRIAPETVKSHAKHVFVKLAVKNRAEAVTRATRLGLI